MVNIILVQFLVLIYCLSFNGLLLASDQAFPLYLHGEKKLDGYFGSKSPSLTLDPYLGKLQFKDDILLSHLFNPYLLESESELSDFIKSELYASALCTNEQFTKHSNYIRYSYRLLALSYLLEASWHLQLISQSVLPKASCGFNFDRWLDSCRPASDDMKKFIHQLRKFRPKYKESLPKDYSSHDWIKEFKSKQFNLVSHYRLENECGDRCHENTYADNLKKSCQRDVDLMTLICSEKDELFGISDNPEAFQLLSQSNIINTFNIDGEAIGCLRRYSNTFRHREVQYRSLFKLFAPMKEHLSRLYQERFIQGRVFFYGSGKEFEDKGLKNLYVMDQPLKISKLSSEELKTDDKLISTVKDEALVQGVLVPEVPKITENIHMNTKLVPQKSAFLLAAELRTEQDLDLVSVDMNKLKYDYVFSLNTLNLLSTKLKSFMTRDAIKEMKMYDKLGSSTGPVPLLFLKYMIDMQEHAGLYNLMSVLGNEFYVSNEIDSSFKTKSEKIKIENGPHTDNQWIISILKP
jgi:hypothetical protein